MIVFSCWLCGNNVSLPFEYKALVECQCGAVYKLEIGGKQIWRLENMRDCGGDAYSARLADSKTIEEVTQNA